METLCLLIDTVAMILVVVYSLWNDQLPPGAPETGVFRIQEPAVRKALEAAKKSRTRGRAR